MELIDTHAHLQFEKFAVDREEVISRNSSQLKAVINPGADLDSSENAVTLSQRVANFYATVGVHPHHADNWGEDYLPKLEKMVTKDKVVAVGEIGLDNHVYQGYPQPDLEKQRQILLPQIKLARDYKKPILFHCRNAYDELYDTIKKYQPISGLVHCFMGDKILANKFVDLGLLISFAGNITYKNNEHMREAAAKVSLDQILLETDSPYLTPEPLRGQRNEPINVSRVAETIAQVRKIAIGEVAKRTTENAERLFNL